MAAASAASTRAAPSQMLEAVRSAARRTAGASAAKKRAAPSQLVAARSAARRMVGASAAGKTAAPSQSLKLQAACTAGFVFGPHSRSPTVRSRCHPQHPPSARRSGRDGCSTSKAGDEALKAAIPASALIPPASCGPKSALRAVGSAAASCYQVNLGVDLVAHRECRPHHSVRPRTGPAVRRGPACSRQLPTVAHRAGC